MKLLRRLLWSAPVLLFTSLACGQTPEDTEKARGVTRGLPLVIAMTAIVIVLAVGLIVAAVGLDRFTRSRKALEDAPPPGEEVEEEEADEVVAGITVGRAPVPKWLYAAYVLIPVFAFAYVVSNVAVAPAQAPEETPAPTGPCTECEISASQIKFSTDELVVAAGEEITVTFENQETGVPHDFTVWEDEADAQGGESVATTGNLNGGSSGTAEFNADDVTYFNCTVHPQSMFGDIVAQ